MDQPPPSSKVLYTDDNLRLVEQGKNYTLEYLSNGEIQLSETFSCRICAARKLLLAIVQTYGHCNCSPSALGLADTDEIVQSVGGFAGGLN